MQSVSSCLRCCLLLALVLTMPSPLLADESRATFRELNPLTGLPDNVVSGFSGWNLALHLGALAATPLIVGNGADTQVHNFFVEHDAFEPLSYGGVYGGYLLPFALGGTLLGVGLLGDSRRELAASGAVLQATALAFVYQSLLKAVTGRLPPDSMAYPDDAASRGFQFGFLRGGIHYGWPSGHLMTTTAIFTSLLPLYPNSVALRVGGGVLLAYMLLSVLSHDASSMHWFSDVVAGSLMGWAIGRGVGAGFARALDKTEPSGAALSISPLLGRAQGVSIGFVF